MRTLHVVLAGAAVAAVAATGSVFTAGNTLPTTNNIAGYGTAQVTGATVTRIAYNPDATDKTAVAQIVFTTSSDITGRTANMTVHLVDHVTPANTTDLTFPCTVDSSYTAGSMNVTCATTDASHLTPPAYVDLDTVGLAVG